MKFIFIAAVLMVSTALLDRLMRGKFSTWSKVLLAVGVILIVCIIAAGNYVNVTLSDIE